jgi:hypothetical protein
MCNQNNEAGEKSAVFAVDVISRIKAHYGAKTDQELAISLGVSKSAIGSWRARNSVPLEALVSIAKDQGISLDWLVFGVPAGAAVDEELMTAVIQEQYAAQGDRIGKVYAGTFANDVLRRYSEVMNWLHFGPRHAQAEDERERVLQQIRHAIDESNRYYASRSAQRDGTQNASE